MYWLKHWMYVCRLTVYGYWNEGGVENVTSMLLHLCNEYFAETGIKPAELITTPQTGCLHPAYSQGYFPNAESYMEWYGKHGPLRGTGAPVVGVLLYRKHVITKQAYIGQLVEQMEACGVIPIPIFINGVEAHTIVRDQLSSHGTYSSVVLSAETSVRSPRNYLLSFLKYNMHRIRVSHTYFI